MLAGRLPSSLLLGPNYPQTLLPASLLWKWGVLWFASDLSQAVADLRKSSLKVFYNACLLFISGKKRDHKASQQWLREDSASSKDQESSCLIRYSCHRRWFSVTGTLGYMPSSTGIHSGKEKIVLVGDIFHHYPLKVLLPPQDKMPQRR